MRLDMWWRTSQLSQICVVYGLGSLAVFSNYKMFEALGEYLQGVRGRARGPRHLRTCGRGPGQHLTILAIVVAGERAWACPPSLFFCKTIEGLTSAPGRALVHVAGI